RASVGVGLAVSAACLIGVGALVWETGAVKARGASQQIRITAHVRAFCRMSDEPRERGMLLEGRTFEGERIEQRFGGDRYRVVCNTPYALQLQRGEGYPRRGDRDERDYRDDREYRAYRDNL